MEKVTVEAEVRSGAGKHALHELRRTGKVPAVLYGGTGKSVNLQLQPRQLANVLGTKSKHHTLFQLQVQGGEETLAMIAETQWEPVRGTLRHVDFKRVLMDRKIRVMVPVIPEGEARGIKEQGGVFEVVLREVEVECLPADLPETFRVDVTPLMIGQHIRVGDVQTQIGDRVRLLRELGEELGRPPTARDIDERRGSMPSKSPKASTARPRISASDRPITRRPARASSTRRTSS